MLTRPQHLGVIQTNCMNYVRTNITELRRIADDNAKQTVEMQKYAEESRKDARDMRRVAFLTMFYLPATALAVRCQLSVKIK
ncbi:hypothetical protein IMZ48_21000 [Candidatus Bathyarchaeota archaeon]|nr:hypothetical protein [Candidatus Bathyarchaeota archaeon]